LNPRIDFGLRLLNKVGIAKTFRTLGAEINAFCILRWPRAFLSQVCIWNVFHRLMSWMLNPHLVALLWKLIEILWGQARRSRSLKTCFWKFYLVPGSTLSISILSTMRWVAFAICSCDCITTYCTPRINVAKGWIETSETMRWNNCWLSLVHHIHMPDWTTPAAFFIGISKFMFQMESINFTEFSWYVPFLIKRYLHPTELRLKSWLYTVSTA
jgi:hypothetical protein